MDLDWVIFPYPKPPTYTISSLKNIIWIPRHKPNQNLSETMNKEEHIPCLFIEHHIKNDKLMIFFHGNKADLGKCKKFLTPIYNNFAINMLCVEYPGYGIYSGKPNGLKILQDSEIVYDFLVNELKIPASDLVLMGRSLGTGPSTHLASVRDPRALILISPYTSLKDVIIGKIGRMGKYIFREKFLTSEKISQVKAPILFIHGKKDTLIPHHHSETLRTLCKSEVHYIYPELMRHKHLDLENDVVPYVKAFFDSIKFDVKYIGGKDSKTIDKTNTLNNFQVDMIQNNINTGKTETILGISNNIKDEMNGNKIDTNLYNSKHSFEGILIPEYAFKLPRYVSDNSHRTIYRKVMDRVWSFIQNNDPLID